MRNTTIKTVTLLCAVALTGALSACTSTPQPEPMATQTAEPSQSASAEPTPTETEAAPPAAAGTRQNPVPIGQVLPFSEDSAFKVGASAPTQVFPDYAVLPLVIQIDWANFNQQATEQGVPTGGPYTPAAGIGISFVTAAGVSYATTDRYIEIENDFLMVGDVYEPNGVINANYAVSVPEGEIPGGVWAIENYGSGAQVFVAAQ
ncbi:hypothetical protein QSU92_01285 [Microbacterium sp. ET2]|uniref:hypothetical protein n=1 Tax=Microbacterium albipurpureum TaxID=3050384 RepID=UPI00259C8C2B|nr:hypothetical protein [Microbacterium sp. ET2 (Ac-2212)]WJL95888.1 hypothetical protein QSU92_01285 [Microbacterium sp. ET2 (Ac-2212)]